MHSLELGGWSLEKTNMHYIETERGRFIFEVCKQVLTPDEYMELYAAVGWSPFPREQVVTALINSNFTVCVKDGQKAVGMGRTVGDGAYMYAILDVAVSPDYQGKGIGRLIIDNILKYIKETVPYGYHVCAHLISTENKEGFYEKFGFGKKPGNGMGHGMMALVIGEKE